MKVFVTYEDYGTGEGCSSPQGVYLPEAEAEAARPKDDLEGPFTYAELKIDCSEPIMRERRLALALRLALDQREHNDGGQKAVMDAEALLVDLGYVSR